MSLTFSEIITLIDDNVDTDSVKYPTAKKTVDINSAINKFFAIALQESGKWQFDDSNHTKDPIVTTNLVSGQRDYHFTVDEQSNFILEFFRVMVADSSGVFYDLEAVDQQSKDYKSLGFVDGQNLTGNPNKYDKTGNGIFLDPIPSYSYTNGLKFFISREASYFTASDTTKKFGACGLFHEYLALRPSYYYAYRKGLAQKLDLLNEMNKMEADIAEYYNKRSKDEPPRIITKNRSSR